MCCLSREATLEIIAVVENDEISDEKCEGSFNLHPNAGFVQYPDLSTNIKGSTALNLHVVLALNCSPVAQHVQTDKVYTYVLRTLRSAGSQKISSWSTFGTRQRARTAV